jgi:hypothetical protein
MQRDDWKFHYTGKQLLEAAKAKVSHHQGKYKWWLATKDSLLNTIRSEGLEVSEAQALQHPGHKARDWNQGARVMVRNDLQTQLDECLRKLAFHTGELDSFQGWVQVFEANPESSLPLDHEDWMFFFGRDQ